jgi:hypothetical protein
MKTIGCFFNKHENVLVAVNNEYHTSYTDSDHKKYHTMRFYECKNCGHRSFHTNYDNKHNRHSGIDSAKMNWIDVRTVPRDSYDPRTAGAGYAPAPVAPPAPSIPATVIPFELIKGGKSE